MSSSQAKNCKFANRRYFVGGSDARIIMGNDETALLRLWREKRGDAEPENLGVQLDIATEHLNRRWYDPITGRMPFRWYIVALCHATVVIYLGWLPWNILLFLLLAPSGGLRAFARSNESLRAPVSCRRGGSL